MKVIELTQGRVAIVDDEDFAELAQYRWCVNGGGYVIRARRKNESWPTRIITMHRWLMKDPKGMEVDHINGEIRDNRRSNLRIATKSQNQRNRRKNKGNRTGLKGVTFEKKKKLFRATIFLNGKVKGLGRFKNPADAKAAYDKAAMEHFGEFAKLN